jgi:hypothetical protein
MRSWYPIPAKELDNKRLLGEHLELPYNEFSNN